MNNWRRQLPVCLVGSSVDDAETLAEARWLALIELDLIAEGQDGFDAYTPAEIQQIRKFTMETM